MTSAIQGTGNGSPISGSREAPLSSQSIASAHRWLQLWNTPDLAAQTTIEWSPRMTRSLGRCYPERRLIRLAAFLDEADNALLEEVLCHELAHLAAHELHGTSTGSIRPHGPEWKTLMRAAGYEPRTRMPAPPNAPKPQPRRRRRGRYLYLHHCPLCQLSRAAKRVVRRWRCAACLTAGLDGILDVFRRAL